MTSTEIFLLVYSAWAINKANHQQYYAPSKSQRSWRFCRGWAETKQFLFILKIYNNDKYPKQNQIGAKYVSTLYSTAKYQIKVF